MIKLVSVIGARPQFIKAAPVEMAIANHTDVAHFSIHTGQHYDDNMSKIFFDDLGLQKPYINLNSGSGSHAFQTAAIMTGLEPVLMEIKPDMIIVYGDTNSTLAAALVASKIHIPVAHIEAGLRSFNRSMPEEINRILTDHVSDLVFAPTENAVEQLHTEGIKNAIKTGDVMLDMIQIARKKGTLISPVNGEYYYATLHRPYNTDNEDRLRMILSTLNGLDKKTVFSVHPRTRNLMVEKYAIDLANYTNIDFIEPQGYFQNLAYLLHCDCLITDSGGMQKEAYFLEKRCLTVRSETEWIETLDNDCNMIVWERPEEIKNFLSKEVGPFKQGLYGDGNSAGLIVKHIVDFINSKQLVG
jgi:UDP-GlcNAc3NAcA epimerase